VSPVAFGEPYFQSFISADSFANPVAYSFSINRFIGVGVKREEHAKKELEDARSARAKTSVTDDS